MKWEKKTRIVKSIAKDYWNRCDSIMRMKMVGDYMNYLNSIQSYEMVTSKELNIILVSGLTWEDIPLHEFPVSSNDIRTSVIYYLGIGEHERSGGDTKGIPDVQLLREYKLRTLDISD